MITCKFRWGGFSAAPFRPDELRPYEGKKLWEIAPEGAVSCWVNGEQIPRDDWESHEPRDGSVIVWVMAEGAIGAAAGIAQLGILATQTFGGIAVAGQVGGAGYGWLQAFKYGLNKLFEQPKLSARDQRVESEASGFGSLANTLSPNAIIPISTGERVIAGHYIQNIRFANQRTGDQTAQVIIALSDGEIQQYGFGGVTYTSDQNNLVGNQIPDGITVAGVPARDARNMRMSIRMGRNLQSRFAPHTNSQGIDPAKPWQEWPQSYTFRRGLPFVWRTPEPTNNIIVNMVFPQGLNSRRNKDGKPSGFGITIRVRGFYDDTGNLAFDRFFSISNNRTNLFYASRYITNIKAEDGSNTPSRLRIIVERTSVAADDGARIRPNPDPADNDGRRFYECDLISILTAPDVFLSYPNVAMVCMTFDASNQIRETIPRILSKGRWLKYVRVAGGSFQWTRNPAYIIRHLSLDRTLSGDGNPILPVWWADNEVDDWADFCDENVPTFTGSQNTEKAHYLDLFLNNPQPLMQILTELAAQARTRILVQGSRFVPQIERERIPSVIFTRSNSRSSLFGASSKNDQANRVEVFYFDEDRLEDTPVSDEFFAGRTGTPTSFPMQGIVRRSEAKRHAAFVARAAQMPAFVDQRETDIEGLSLSVNDLYEVFDYVVEDSQSGRISSSTVSTTVLDRPVTLVAGSVYQYIERNASGAILQSEFLQASNATTDTLPFPPLSSDPAVGRIWALIQKTEKRRQFIATSISRNKNGITRIVGIEYVPEVFSYASDPTEDDLFSNVPVVSPPDVTALTLQEFYDSPGVSRVSASWSAAAGAVSYDVWLFNLAQDEGFFYIANTSGLSQNIFTNLPGGTNIEIVIVPVNAAGFKVDPDDVTSDGRATITLLRDDDNAIIPSYPNAPTNGILTQDSFNEYTLSWTAPTTGPTPTGYEIAEGFWHGRFVVGTVTGLFQGLFLTRFSRRYIVRSYRDIAVPAGGTKRYYSADELIVASPPDQLPDGITTEEAIAPIIGPITAWSIQNATNGSLIDNPDGLFGRALIAISNEFPLEYFVDVELPDLDSYYISWRALFSSFFDEPLNDFSLANPAVLWSGQTNVHYVDCVVELVSFDGTRAEYNDDPTLATVRDITNTINENVYASGKYFQLRIRLRVVPELNSEPIRPLLYALGLSINS